MDNTEAIARGRAFAHCRYLEYAATETEQQKRMPPPSSGKPAMSDQTVALPKNLGSLPMKGNLYELFKRRESRRLYADKPISLLELSFILWASEGVKTARGSMTFRTSPSAGARHPFELYVAVIAVDDLPRGFYHYLPFTHEIERVADEYADFDRDIAESLVWQDWASSASFVLYWSMLPRRTEWRYGGSAARFALIDLGHRGENVYLAAEALGRGTCGIGAIDEEKANGFFSLDGENEFIVYAQPVGIIKA